MGASKNKTPFVIVILVGLLGCVSKSVFDQRFRESSALPPPPNSVSIGDPENYTFAVVGDLHIRKQDTTRLQAIFAAAQAEGDAFIVFLGDIVDQGDPLDVQAFRTAITTAGWDGKAFPVIGNHDVFNDGWTSYKQLNGPSHYTFNVGNAKFIVLDSADGTLGSEQGDWLKAELEKPKPELLFMATHYLPVVPGVRTYLKLSDDVEALKLMNLASKKGVNAWFGAHYHSYLVGGAEGVTYVVAGGGGGRRMEPVLDYFFVQVQVAAGTALNYFLRTVP